MPPSANIWAFSSLPVPSAGRVRLYQATGRGGQVPDRGGQRVEHLIGLLGFLQDAFESMQSDRVEPGDQGQ